MVPVNLRTVVTAEYTEESIKAIFTKAEYKRALEMVKRNSAPRKDGIQNVERSIRNNG